MRKLPSRRNLLVEYPEPNWSELRSLRSILKSKSIFSSSVWEIWLVGGFGSSEYFEWENTQYNDVFGFFISGPGISGPYSSPPGFPNGSINIATVPNSNPPLPITISSINNVLNNNYYIYDKELRQRLGNRGRKLAEKTHNWEKCEERIESLYRYVKNKSTLQA